MRFRVVASQLLGGLCGWAAYVALTVPAAQAQGPIYSGPCSDCSQPAPAPGPLLPEQPLMPRAGSTSPTSPTETPTNPGQTAPNPAENNAVQNEANTNQENANSNFSGSQGLASGAGSFSSPGGYLDDAIPQTVFRLRYESRNGINEFDRATYMYDTWRELSFHNHALVTNGAPEGVFSVDPKAKGSQIFAAQLNDQTISSYLEVALSERLSVFAEVPMRFVHFGDIQEEGTETAIDRSTFKEVGEVRNPNIDPIGLSDTQAGVKYALVADPNNQYVTFQFQTYIPTGDSGLGLGTGHVSLEPGFLLFQRLSDRLVLQGEFTDWIPIDAGPGGGNVLSYGAGVGYDVIQRCNLRVTPVAEFVGWTVLGGTEAFNGPITGATTIGTPPNTTSVVNVGGQIVPGDHGAANAGGDTIINAKIGVRTYFGQRSDVYLGYGHTLTGDRWYTDIARVEYRLHF